jgi:C-terminal processing protease CtpA/Prc
MRPLLILLSCLGACSLSPKLPEQSPPLANLEEPLDLRAEPDDEAERQKLPAGCFSGLYLEDARDTLASKLQDQGQLKVVQVVENSPAAAAGIQVEDLLLEAVIGTGEPISLLRPSDWRRIELQTAPGTAVQLVVDRAGREATARLVLVPRLAPPPRQPGERLREDQRVGVVFRTATEVEARAAELPPGAGAVVVGLAANSPWRTAGLRFGDLLTHCNGAPIRHPQDLLQAIQRADAPLRLAYRRQGSTAEVEAATSRRAQELREISLPLLFHYEYDRKATEWSCLLGIFHYRSTTAAWRFRFLWLMGFGGGDADRLLEVDA